MSLPDSEIAFVKKVGKSIIDARKRMNMKQRELADLLDMDDGSLRRIESGRTNPTITTLKKIADKLEISVSELLNF